MLLAAAGIAILAAVMAGSAQAESKTESSHWVIEGVPLAPAGGFEFVKCSFGEHVEKKFVLEGKIGEGAGIPFKLPATGIDCINHEGEPGVNGTAKIVQEGKSAQDRQRWIFTNVTISEPSNCVVQGGQIITNPLKSEVFHDVAEPKIIFKKFEPTGTSIAAITLINGGGKTCSIAGNRILKGSWFGEFELHTEVEAVNQPLTFSKSVDLTAGGILTFAGNAASLTGTLNTELAEVNAGKKWGVKRVVT